MTVLGNYSAIFSDDVGMAEIDLGTFVTEVRNIAAIKISLV